MDALDRLLDAAKAATDPAARQQAVRDALAALDGANLPELEQAAAAQFETLATPSDAGFDSETVDAMGTIADVVDAIRAEAADQQTARVAELGTRIGKPSIPAATTPQPETPEAPAAPEVPEAPETEQPQQPEPAPDPVEAPTPTEAPIANPAHQEPALVAPGRKPAVVPLEAMPKNLPAVRSATVITLTAAADIPGFPMGATLDGVDGLTKAAMSRLYALSRAGKDTSAGIAVIEREQTDSKLIADRPDDYQTIAYACDETRLPGGSLTAAAGWCAPAEQMYDEFCPVATVDGLVSLPTVTARRGGITWPTTPDFSQIYSGSGFYMPIEEMEKGEGTPLPTDRRDKPCYLIQCTGVQTATLDVYGLCVKVPTLTERAYPELVSHVTQQILAAHAHKMNAVTLAKMEALATANTVTQPGTGDFPYGPGATATALGLIELQVEYLRYHYRLGMTATMEMVAPAFLRGILRSDLAKRNGVDMINVSNSTLDTYFRDRGVNVQYVLDWQDAFAGPTQVYDTTDATTAANTRNATNLPTYSTTGFGGNTAPKVWPATVKVLIYPAGTYFKLTNDIITIDGLFDSSLLARNLHLALFSEEGMEVALRGCYTPISLTMPLCATGATGAQQAVLCPSA